MIACGSDKNELAADREKDNLKYHFAPVQRAPNMQKSTPSAEIMPVLPTESIGVTIYTPPAKGRYQGLTIEELREERAKNYPAESTANTVTKQPVAINESTEQPTKNYEKNMEVFNEATKEKYEIKGRVISIREGDQDKRYGNYTYTVALSDGKCGRYKTIDYNDYLEHLVKIDYATESGRHISFTGTEMTINGCLLIDTME